MTDPSQGRPSHRFEPAAPGFSATFRHIDGWQALSITASPQIMELVVTNRTAQPVRGAPALLSLAFRPGVLDRTEDIRLAPQSEASWALAVQDTDAGVTVSLAGVDKAVVMPGDALTIRLEGFTAAEAGGSRASRVAFEYGGFHHPDGVEIAGAQQLHLPILRRHAPIGIPAKALRTGSIARSGPFEAGFKSGAGVLNDGLSVNDLVLSIVNTGGLPLAMATGDDAATKVHISFETGPWGVLAGPQDRLNIASAGPDWDITHHTLTRSNPAPWGPRAAWDISFRIHSSANAGQAQLILTYENLPGHDDGTLVLLLDLGSIADRKDRVDMVRPLVLRGDKAALAFDPGDVTGTGVGEDLPGFSISDAHESRGQLDLNAPHGLDINGAIARPYFPRRTRQSFKIAGRLDRFYPVVFLDLDWSYGPVHLMVFRHWTHTDERRRGTLQLDVRCHSPGWGHGADFFEIKGRQSGLSNSRFSQSGVPFRRFVGGFENHIKSRAAVLYLAGNTTYFWRADHPVRIDNQAYLDDPGDRLTYPATGSASQNFEVKTAPDDGYSAASFAIEHSFGRDTAAVPRGTIVMWSGTASNIPMGWALCDGADGRPNLIDRFVMGAGKTNAGEKGGPTQHRHYVSGQSIATSYVAGHTHKLPSTWYSRNKDSGAGRSHTVLDTGGMAHKAKASTKKVQSDGGHNHSATVAGVVSNNAVVIEDEAGALNRPRWFALCYIIKL